MKIKQIYFLVHMCRAGGAPYVAMAYQPGMLESPG
jgi:hypothetical protein